MFNIQLIYYNLYTFTCILFCLHPLRIKQLNYITVISLCPFISFIHDFQNIENINIHNKQPLYLSLSLSSAKGSAYIRIETPATPLLLLHHALSDAIRFFVHKGIIKEKERKRENRKSTFSRNKRLTSLSPSFEQFELKVNTENRKCRLTTA